MSLDAFFYCAPCRLKVLAAPLGSVSASCFARALVLLRQHAAVVSLEPLARDERLARAQVSPAVFPRGQLLFDFVTEWDPHYAYLEDFQHWRKLYAVIAIQDGSLSEDIQMQQLDGLRAKFNSALLFRAFDPSASASSEGIENFILEFSTRLLLAISDMAQAIQALPTIRSPAEPTSSALVSSEQPQEVKRPASVGPGALQRTPSSSSIKMNNRNSVVVSQNSSTENLAEKRGSSKGRGRVLKVLGDIHLLCVEILRLTTDYIWHASALEGVAMALILLRFLNVDFSIPAILQPQVSFASPPVEPGKSQSQPDLSLSNDITTDPFASQSLLDVLPDTHHHILHLNQRSLGSSSADPLPLVCFPDNILRLATLLCDVFAQGVLDHAVLKANILGVPIVHKSSNPNMYPPRGEIARWAMRAWGSHLEQESVPVSHHIRVVSALVNIMGIIGFHRKRSALLSELLHLFIPQLVQARVIGASEWGLHPNAAQSYVGHNTADDGLVQLMSSLASIYGVQTAPDDRGIFGWPSLRTHILKECIAFCEALPHPAGIAHFTSLLFSVAPGGLEKDEQIRLASSLPRIVAHSRRRGDLVEADYWDEFAVQDIQIVESVKAPSFDKFNASDVRTSLPCGPFLYSARGENLQASPPKSVCVQGEDVIVNVLLRNKFEFDLEVVAFTLWTEGPPIEMPASSFILPAQSLYTHSAVFMPNYPGDIIIKGCTIRFSACKMRNFAFYSPRSRRDKELWYDERNGEIKVKQIGTRPQTSPIVDEPTEDDTSELDGFWRRRTLNITILPPQPVLVLESIVLQDSALMLLEGERVVIKLRFRNTSPSIAKHLTVSFYDSTRSVLEEALTLTALAEEEAVELEYFLYDRPAFVWLHASNSSISIPPAAEEEISIQALGKRGLVHGTVCVEYASSEIVPAHVGNYSRRIEVPLPITVNAALELVGCDFTTFKPESSIHIRKDDGLDTRFIIVLELKNSWINALQLAITATEPGRSDRKFLEIIQSGQTRRCAIDLPRVLLAPPDAETRLPRRNKVQQFVVSSSPSEAAHRRAWWYRERILNSLSAEWSEQLSDGRKGEVDLRGIRLSERHIPIVGKEGVGVEVRVTKVEQSVPVQIVFQLIVVINNLQDSFLKLAIRVVVAARDQDENSQSICCDGIDESPVLAVKAHQAVSWSTDLTFLSSGILQIGAMIEERDQRSERKGNIWFSDMCHIEIPEAVGEES